MSETDLSLEQPGDIELQDPIEIRRLLALMPKLIFKSEAEAVEADTVLGQASNALEVAKAKAQLEAGTIDELTAAEDRKAWARTRPGVMEAELVVLNAKADLKLAQLSLKKYENYFVSVRKAANIFEVLEKASNNANRYG